MVLFTAHCSPRRGAVPMASSAANKKETDETSPCLKAADEKETDETSPCLPEKGVVSRKDEKEGNFSGKGCQPSYGPDNLKEGDKG